MAKDKKPHKKEHKAKKKAQADKLKLPKRIGAMKIPKESRKQAAHWAELALHPVVMGLLATTLTELAGRKPERKPVEPQTGAVLNPIVADILAAGLSAIAGRMAAEVAARTNAK